MAIASNIFFDQTGADLSRPMRAFRIAARTSPGGRYATTFARARARVENSDAAVVASRMGMAAEQYVALESGEIHPSQKMIERFCAALPCHPVDLHDGTLRGPMTTVMVDVLLALVKNDAAPQADRLRAVYALRGEHQKSTAILNRHGDRGLAPLKDVEWPMWAMDGVLVDDVRTTLDNYAEAMDRLLADEYSLLAQSKTMLRKNRDAMQALGGLLYGQSRQNAEANKLILAGAGAEAVAAGGFDTIRDTIQNAAEDDLRRDVCLRARKGSVTYQGDVLPLRAALLRFVDYVETHVELSQAVDWGVGIGQQICAVKNEQRNFREWRSLIKTDVLLVCLENTRRIAPVLSGDAVAKLYRQPMAFVVPAWVYK